MASGTWGAGSCEPGRDGSGVVAGGANRNCPYLCEGRQLCSPALGVAKSRSFFFREFHGIRPSCPPRPAPELQSARARAQMAGAPAKVPDLAAVDWRFSAEKKKKRKSNAGLPATFQRGKRVFAAHARVSTALRIFALGPSRWVLGEFWASPAGGKKDGMF